MLGLLWFGLAFARSLVTALPPLPLAVALPIGVLCVPVFVAVRAGVRSHGWLTATLVSAVVLYLANVEVNRSLWLAFVGLALPVGHVSATVGRRLADRWLGRRRALVIGPARAASPIVAALRRRGHEVVAVHGFGEVHGFDEVHLAGSWSAPDALALLRRCADSGIPLSVDGSALPLPIHRVDLVEAHGTSAVTFHPASDREPARLAKRAFDMIGGMVLLVLVAPVLAVAAGRIWWSGTGPVLFWQTRLGRYGRPFVMVKLRTMVVGAEKSPVGWPKPRSDARVTPVGAWLRRWSIDELPQLVHCVTGEMSLVGPRPPLPSEASAYAAHEWRRLSVRPGLTGLWQVSGRADLPLPQTMALDLAYVDGWTPWLDLRVLVRTVPAVVRGKGAR